MDKNTNDEYLTRKTKRLTRAVCRQAVIAVLITLVFLARLEPVADRLPVFSGMLEAVGGWFCDLWKDFLRPLLEAGVNMLGPDVSAALEWVGVRWNMFYETLEDTINPAFLLLICCWLFVWITLLRLIIAKKPAEYDTDEPYSMEEASAPNTVYDSNEENDVEEKKPTEKFGTGLLPLRTRVFRDLSLFVLRHRMKREDRILYRICHSYGYLRIQGRPSDDSYHTERLIACLFNGDITAPVGGENDGRIAVRFENGIPKLKGQIDGGGEGRLTLKPDLPVKICKNFDKTDDSLNDVVCYTVTWIHHGKE